MNDPNAPGLQLPVETFDYVYQGPAWLYEHEVRVQLPYGRFASTGPGPHDWRGEGQLVTDTLPGEWHQILGGVATVKATGWRGRARVTGDYSGGVWTIHLEGVDDDDG